MILRSARAARGRWSGYSQLVYVCGSHGYGGLDGGRDGAGVWYACGTKPGGYSHVERCHSTFRVRGDKLMIPDHTTIQVRSSG